MELKQVEYEKKIGVGVIFIKSDGSILVTNRYSTNGKNTFGPPGGHVKDGESLIDAAIRKTKDETNIKLGKHHFKCPPFVFETKHEEVRTIYTSHLFVIQWDKFSIDCSTFYEDLENKEPEKQSDWIWLTSDKLMYDYFDELFYPLKEWVKLKIQHKMLSL